VPEISHISLQEHTERAASGPVVMPVQESLMADLYQCTVQRFPFQRKLSIGSTNKHEADTIANTIMGMPVQNFTLRKCNHCGEEKNIYFLQTNF
jgi:hypothetical protein